MHFNIQLISENHLKCQKKLHMYLIINVIWISALCNGTPFIVVPNDGFWRHFMWCPDIMCTLVSCEKQLSQWQRDILLPASKVHTLIQNLKFYEFFSGANEESDWKKTMLSSYWSVVFYCDNLSYIFQNSFGLDYGLVYLERMLN